MVTPWASSRIVEGEPHHDVHAEVDDTGPVQRGTASVRIGTPGIAIREERRGGRRWILAAFSSPEGAVLGWSESWRLVSILPRRIPA